MGITQGKGAGKSAGKVLLTTLGLVECEKPPLRLQWRTANRGWRRERKMRIAAHSRRIAEQMGHIGRPAAIDRADLPSPSRPRQVWCVELQQWFGSLTAAAQFVHRNPSNISQAVRRGCRCGPYHWEDYDPREHRRLVRRNARRP